jgi:hypothetical protein
MSKARLVITALFVDHQTPAEVAARYGVHRAWVYKLKARLSVVKIFGPTVVTNVGPTWLLGFGVEERFAVVATEQEGEPVEVAS